MKENYIKLLEEQAKQSENKNNIVIKLELCIAILSYIVGYMEFSNTNEVDNFKDNTK